MYNDFLYKLPKQSRGKFFKAGMPPDKTRRQDIEIYYSFVGKVDLPE